MEAIEKQKVGSEKSEKVGGEDRLVMLCDGVFAIAMTLLALEIKLPEGITGPELDTAMRELLTGKILMYVITFGVLGGYWVGHRRLMLHVKRLDTVFIWLTIIFLAFIVLFPAALTLMSGHGRYDGSVIFYTLSLAGCGFSANLLWVYASWGHRLIDNQVVQYQIVFRSISTFVIPAVFCLSLLLLLIPDIREDPTNIFYSWFILVVIAFIYRGIRLLMEKRAAYRLLETNASTEVDPVVSAKE